MNSQTNIPMSQSVSHVDIGPFSKLAGRPDSVLAGKVFLSRLLGLTGCEISLNRLPAGRGYPFRHKHRRNEEVYLFLAGTGVFLAGEREIPVSEGSVIRLAPEVERTLGASEDGPLDFVCFQCPQGAMPYSFMEDGFPTTDQVPFPSPLPLPEPLRVALGK